MVARTRSSVRLQGKQDTSEDAESYAADYSRLDLKVGSLKHRLVTAQKANDFMSDNCVCSELLCS